MHSNNVFILADNTYVYKVAPLNMDHFAPRTATMDGAIQLDTAMEP